MPIYTLKELREKSGKSYKDLSDEEFLRKYSEWKRVPFDDVANYFGVEPRSTISQMGTSIVRGLTETLPKQVGDALQWSAIRPDTSMMFSQTNPNPFSRAMGVAQSYLSDVLTDKAREIAPDIPSLEKPIRQGLETTGKEISQAAEARGKQYMPPDLRGKGWVASGLIEGSESLPSIAATTGLSLFNPLLGAGSAYSLYGFSSAKETYDKLIKEGVPEDQALAAALRVEAVQGGGEAALNALGARVARPFSKAFGAGTATTTAAVAQQFADTSILKPAAKAYVTSLLAETATEPIQDVATAYIEEAYGAKPQDKLEIAQRSARAAFGAALLFGPLTVGSYAARSKRAQEIQAALADDPSVPPEQRAEILQAIAGEAKRQGIGPADVDNWLKAQVAMADRDNVALGALEDAARNNYVEQFEAAYNAPSGRFVSEPDDSGNEVRRQLSMGELLEQQANATSGDNKIDLLGGATRSPRQVLADIRASANDPLTPSVWRFPVSTGLGDTSQRAMFTAGPQNLLEPRPVRGDLTSGQQAALGGTPPMGAGQIAALQGPVDQTVPRPSMGLGAAQQFAAAGPEAQTSATTPVSPQGLQNIEALRAASQNFGATQEFPAYNPAGLFAPATPVAQQAPSGGPSATLSPSATPAPGVFSTAPAAPKAAKPAKAVVPKKPAAPSDIEKALEEELDLADTASDAARVKSILSAVNKEELGAEVQGAKQIKAPGRVSLSQRSLLGIRDAIFRKSGKVAKAFGRNEQKIVDAVRRFTNAYDAYLNFSTNLSREVKKGIASKADQRIANMDELAKEVQNALFALGQSMDNNAKNVEAVVRVVKDAAQRKLANPGKTKKETLDAIESLDSVFSSGWAAAKRESFMKELPDLADVSGQQIRPSTEKQEKGKTISAVEDAAKNGYSNPKYNYGKRYTGLAGVLQYLRFNTTPMGRVLAIALRDALVDSKNPAKVVFTDKGRSRYDPKTNTVYINRGEQSAEVILHETFHAALQWFVYQNPDLPAVKQLQLSLERALGAKGLEGKALEVQQELQKLVNNERGLDAVLELVSYTATLNDFRRAMQEIKTGDAPKSFLESVRSVWAMYKAIVRRMLGVNDTVASDVLSASMDLLEKSRSSKYAIPEKLTGNVLEAKVQSGKQKVTPGTSIPSSLAAAASGQNIMMSKSQLSNYTKTLLPRFMLTEILFKQLGWQDWMKYADKKWVTPFNKFIQKQTPRLAQTVAWFNSHYGLESNTVEMLVGMKDARRGGTAVSEKIAKYIANLPVQKSKELLTYMNSRLDYLRGTGKEPTFAGDTLMKRLADQAIDNWWKYATEGAMSAKDRAIFAGTKVGNRWVGGLKFTEGFVFPDNVNQIASGSFGSRNMRELKSRRQKDEVNADNIRFRVDNNGDAIIDDKFVGIYNDTPQLRARLQAGESLANIMPDEFISADLFDQATPLDNKGQAMIHDPAFTWDLQKKGKNGFRFTAHYDAREAYSAKKALDVANAFHNTMTLLANSYASNRFAKGLYEIGTTKVGKDLIRDGSAVVFDDIDQLNEALNGEGIGADFKPQKDRSKWAYEIKPNKIISISATESRAERVKNMFRNRNQWVLVPKGRGGEVYGALSGKIVSGSVWAAIQDASNSQPVIPFAAFNSLMRFFKSVKTVYMPPTWANNVLTNVMFSIADDIPLSTLPHAARLYAASTMSAEARKKARLTLSPAEEELMVKILNSNALLGTFATDEIKQSVYESMLANLDGPEQSLYSRMVQMAGVDKARIEAAEKFAANAKDKASAVNNFMTEWYSAQDNIFRVASVLNYLGKAADAGMDINEDMVYRAGRHARDAFLDYDIDAKAIKIMRQTAFPFISFPYAAAKLIGRLAVHAPWKLVNIYAAAMIADAMLASMADDDDEETRRTGPERFRERLLGGFGPHAYFRTPFLGDSENPVYYHVGKYLFVSSLVDTPPEGFMGIKGWPSAITPSGPFIDGIIGAIGGVDPFTKEPLSPKTASSYEMFIDRLKYLQGMVTPNLPFINARETEKFMDIAKGRVDQPDNSTSLALARYLGLRLYSYNVDAEFEAQDRAAKGIEADFKREIGKIRRKTERMEDPDWEAFAEREEELLRRMEERIAERRGEEPMEEEEEE